MLRLNVRDLKVNIHVVYSASYIIWWWWAGGGGGKYLVKWWCDRIVSHLERSKTGVGIPLVALCCTNKETTNSDDGMSLNWPICRFCLSSRCLNMATVYLSMHKCPKAVLETLN